MTPSTSGGADASERNVPRATYRLQLHADFGFDAAASVVPYLARLGVSHVYSSPVLQAEPGSPHGYDVVDHGRISTDLGGEAGFDRLVAALRSHAMGLVVDVVPNHMSIASEHNRWWWDVLEHGRASRYADWFDVEWDMPEPGLADAVLLPVLPEEPEAAIAAGRIQLVGDGSRVLVVAGPRRYPLAPGSLDRAVEAVNASPGALAALLARQHYRLAEWRAGAKRLGYRRFFDVDTLIGLRVEREDVFSASHRVILERVAAGEVSGLRIDHPDGLRDPHAYLARLRAAAPTAWIVVEKILELHEPLPAEWPVAGTTGYRFANLATRLGVDPGGEGPLSAAWARVAGDSRDWAEVAHRSRVEVLSGGLASDVRRLARRLAAVLAAAGVEPRPADKLAAALRELLAAMDVYRTYLRTDHPPRDDDRAAIQRAVEAANRRRPQDADLFDLLGRVLRLEVSAMAATEVALRFQQLAPAAMAKGVEDTALYRYLRLVALNEVGGDPAVFSLEPATVARMLDEDGERWPTAMLSTSTHDTKRGEDVRARLGLLSEIPDAWSAAVAELTLLAAPHRSGPQLPDDATVYLLLQTLVGAWPLDADRAAAYLWKAAREAKLRTSWTDPAADYEYALERLVRGCLADPAFVGRLESFVLPLIEPGRTVSLAQLLLKLTAPGVPDLYQGTELWDDSLVDPDNRRPVDFARRGALLAGLEGMTSQQVLARGTDGAPKLWLAHRALDLRRRRPHLFGSDTGIGSLRARGARRRHAMAFRRGPRLVALAPRLPLGLLRAGGWGDTTLTLPDGRWHDVLSGRSWSAGDRPVRELLGAFPVALLERAE